jgi:AcrR family transcriptional regulator
MTRAATAPQSVDTMTDRQLQRRHALLDAVMQLAVERGVDNVQMKLVAERSGVALGTTYRYFASKEHLLASALVDWHARLTDRTLAESEQRAFAVSSDAERVDRLVEFLQRGMRGFHRYPSYADLLVYVNGSRDPFASEALHEMSIRTDRVLRLILGPQLAEGTLETLSFVVGSIWLNAIMTWRAGRHSFQTSYQQCEDGVRLVCAGLLAFPDISSSETGLPRASG